MNKGAHVEYAIDYLVETSIDVATEHELARLLESCFPDTFSGRTYYKQLPHARLLHRQDGAIVGQLGLDFRIIRVGGVVIRTLGVIDLCVAPGLRLQGRATAMLDRVAAIAEQARADFQILFADNPVLYLHNGYEAVEPARMRWVGIENRETHGVIERDLTGILMARPTGDRSFPPGKIDLLGYLF
jgi:GNAT superfamily N-acetyltransferase